ncbi:MAG TPA: hypothetical protein VF457_05180, partial [Burkholderiaceae bacterium]
PAAPPADGQAATRACFRTHGSDAFAALALQFDRLPDAEHFVRLVAPGPAAAAPPSDPSGSSLLDLL